MKIITLGEILVEIMAEKVGQKFTQAGSWLGPFASGAPAIFIDQVSKMGCPAAIIGCVGHDDFGQLNTHRLQQDGVDISGIHVLTNETTGSAFVTYQPDGSRDFIFNIQHAACGRLSVQHLNRPLLNQCTHLHIMGSSLFSLAIIDAIKQAAEIIKKNGGSVSFDPNIRKEMLGITEMRDALYFMLGLTDIYMPSDSEITLLSSYHQEDEAIADFLEQGIKEVVVKRGNQGASYHSAKETHMVKAYTVDEVDPTGAGDCFAGTYIAARQLGYSIIDALNYANASGAMAVGQRGPMEGTATRVELERFMAQHH